MEPTVHLTKKATIVTWTCPACKRQFRRQNQQHSCALYPIEKHKQGKSQYTLNIYEALLERVRQLAGNFTVESLPCCIHLVNNAYTFAAVYLLRHKIQLHIVLRKPTNNPRVSKIIRMSDNRYPASIEINTMGELDDQLFDWLRQAYSASLE